MRPVLLLAAALACAAPPPPVAPATTATTRLQPAAPIAAARPALTREPQPRAHIEIRGLSDLAPAEAAAIERRIAGALDAHPALTTDRARATTLGIDGYGLDVGARLARRGSGAGAGADVDLTLSLSSPDDRLLAIWRRRAQIEGAPPASTDSELWDLALDTVLDGAADHVATTVGEAARARSVRAVLLRP
jgi:hypothetical protein